mmetsp:Transcript_53709/g.165237  ORF Transcript_53709/g.165237 Transcript_53709/m.165237 type:complete len:267 (-) Transcript_53709:953-1753(-)
MLHDAKVATVPTRRPPRGIRTETRSPTAGGFPSGSRWVSTKQRFRPPDANSTRAHSVCRREGCCCGGCAGCNCCCGVGSRFPSPAHVGFAVTGIEANEALDGGWLVGALLVCCDAVGVGSGDGRTIRGWGGDGAAPAHASCSSIATSAAVVDVVRLVRAVVWPKLSVAHPNFSHISAATPYRSRATTALGGERSTGACGRCWNVKLAGGVGSDGGVLAASVGGVLGVALRDCGALSGLAPPSTAAATTGLSSARGGSNAATRGRGT